MTDPPEHLRPVPPEPDPSKVSPELEGLDPGALFAAARTPISSAARSGGWEPPEPDSLGNSLAGYRIIRLLGRGGMGAVYEGEQVSLERRVAIKLLPPELGADLEFQARFRREAKSMARLNHPNIVQIYDFGRTEAGHYYFVMEFVDGTDLHRLIREGQLDVTGALNAVSQICDALHYAHDEGFVHRDIKPANIFVNRQGMVKVGDFGLAKLVEGSEADEVHAKDLLDITLTGMAMGTLNYIAPEQLVEGGSVDRRADIYSLGVMFYEMLTREVPRGAVKEPSKLIAMLDVRIDGVVFKAMDPDPSERYQTAVELRSDVDVIRTVRSAQTSETAEEASPSRERIRVAPPRSGRKRRAGKELSLLSVTGAVLAAAAAVTGWWFFRGPETTAPSSTVTRSEKPVKTVALPPEFAAVTKDAPFTNSLGMTFVPLPGTGLLMGRHETRKADYAAFAEAVGGRSDRWKDPMVEGKVPVSPGEDHPVTNVSWKDAVSFCEWLSRREGRTYRLPTDREWSMAAQIAAVEPPGLTPRELDRLRELSTPTDGAGNFADLSWARTVPNRSGGREIDDTFPTTSPVMAFAPNSLGIHDLTGNVWEYCQDFLDGTQEHRTLRGHCWNDTMASWRSRAGRPESNLNSTDGFRCVLVAVEEKSPEVPPVVFTNAGEPIRFGLSRYQLVLGEADWDQARDEAERRGGHLATFGTLAERDWVENTFAERASKGAIFWLGGHGPSAQNPKMWIWVTGESMTVPAWSGGSIQGSDSKAPFHYAALAGGEKGELHFSLVSSTAGPGKGFLVEWEDIDGAPALTVAGTPPETGVNSLGMKFLPVPGTDIQLCIHETRKSDYAAFAAESAGVADAWRNPPSYEGMAVSANDDDPVVMVNWHEARAFCEWLSRKEGRSYRLPTDREWSMAAGIGDFESVEALPGDLSSTHSRVSLFPWGINRDETGNGMGNFFGKEAQTKFRGRPQSTYWNDNDGFLTTAPVMSFPPNPLGFHDLHGNVSEVCEDAWGRRQPEWAMTGLGSQFAAIRGGHWADLPGPLTERERSNRDKRSHLQGFRIALVTSESEPKAPLAERTRPVGQPKRFGSSRYQYVEGAVTWGEARVRAEQMGGHLATLAFEPEAKWVEKEYGSVLGMTGSGAWIGLIFHSGRRWITGERWVYDDWQGSYPPGLFNSSALQNLVGGVLTRSTDGIGWNARPLDGSGENPPKGFLVEWEDIDGDPPLPVTGNTSRDPLTNSLGMRFVPVAGADVLICVHETRRRDYAAYAEEAGLIDEGWIQPALDGVPAGHEDDHPVVMVNWHEARAFCDWLSRKEGRTYRLPTDREWSLAAGLGEMEDASTPADQLSELRSDSMPWGVAWPPPAGSGNFADLSLKKKLPNRDAIEGFDDGFATTSPVMHFSPLRGIYDLSGNVSEWTEDLWPGRYHAPILRGGDWFSTQGLALSHRKWDPSAYRRFYFGFRCALVVTEGNALATTPAPAPAPKVAASIPATKPTPAPTSVSSPPTMAAPVDAPVP